MTDDTTAQTAEEQDHLKQLREKAKRADEAEAKIADLQRKLVFQEAGIPSTGMGTYFMKGYDGELDADKVRAAAIEAGLLEAPREDAISQEELAAHQRLSQVGAGASGPSLEADRIMEQLKGARNTDQILRLIRDNNLYMPHPDARR